MSQHHFVLQYDTKTSEWIWDTDTEESNFKGCIYLDDLDVWTNSSYSTEIYDMDNSLSDDLGKAINYLNTGVK